MAFSYFFRDQQTLDYIEKYIIPNIKARRYIKIWDAGCAMGYEPYSLAIIMRENMGKFKFRNLQIFATDIDISDNFEDIIYSGIYSRTETGRIPKNILHKYFTKLDSGEKFQISTEMRKSVKFIKHDLRTFQAPISRANLVVCKNVLLHLQPEERIKVFRMFHNTLESEGFLITEQTQKLPKNISHLFKQLHPSAKLYKKV